MRKAVDALTNAIPADVLSQDDGVKLLLAVDGKFVPYKTVDGKMGLYDRRFDMQQEAVIKGDNKILSVAAASIVAKVYRDDLMRKLHKKHPAYNFAQHKGYATLHHRQMISKYGLSKLHRLSFCKNIEIKAN
jgi:ribonuclease HII